MLPLGLLDGTVAGLWGEFVSWLEIILVKIVDVLPNSPFQKMVIPAELTNVLGYLNWFIPVAFMSSVMGFWTSAIFVYYAYILILRWTKAVK